MACLDSFAIFFATRFASARLLAFLSSSLEFHTLAIFTAPWQRCEAGFLRSQLLPLVRPSNESRGPPQEWSWWMWSTNVARVLLLCML